VDSRGFFANVRVLPGVYKAIRRKRFFAIENDGPLATGFSPDIRSRKGERLLFVQIDVIRRGSQIILLRHRAPNLEVELFQGSLVACSGRHPRLRSEAKSVEFSKVASHLNDGRS